MSYIKKLASGARKVGDKVASGGKDLVGQGVKVHKKVTENVKDTVRNPLKAIKDVHKEATVRTVPKEIRDAGRTIDYETGKAIGGKSAQDRLSGAVQGGILGYQTGGPWGALAGVVAGGAIGASGKDKLLGGGGGGGGIMGGNAPGINIPEHLLAGTNTVGGVPVGGLPVGPSSFQGFDPNMIKAPTVENQMLASIGNISAPEDIQAAQMAAIEGIQAPDAITAQQVALGGPSQYAANQQRLIEALEGRVAGTAGPSLAELQMQKAQQDMINQMAAQAGSMSGRAMPAAQRQLMQQQALSGQQLALDSAILRAQEQQQAEAQLAGALGQYRGQDLQRTGLGLQADTTNQQAMLQAAGLTQEGAMQAALANQQADLATAQANLQAQREADRLNQQAALQATLANQSTALGAAKAQLLADTDAERLRATLGVDTSKFNEAQKLEAAQLAEQARQADIGAATDAAKTAASLEAVKLGGQYDLLGAQYGAQATSDQSRQDLIQGMIGKGIEAGASSLMDYLASDDSSTETPKVTE